jgi:hypothetical protein
MRILFAISLVALAALLWASVSIAQHIYRARKQQHVANRYRKQGQPTSTVGQIIPPTSTSAPKVVAKADTPQRKAS